MQEPEASGMLKLAQMYGPARPLSDREAWYIDSALTAYGTIKGPGKEIIGDWLVAKAKTFKGWPSAYSFFNRTSKQRCWNIAAYHHPASLCWSWMMSVSIGRAVLGSWRHPFYRFGGQVAICIPHVIEFRFHRQRSDWMVSLAAEQMLSFLCMHNRETRP
jgi:hypothetical protein